MPTVRGRHHLFNRSRALSDEFFGLSHFDIYYEPDNSTVRACSSDISAVHLISGKTTVAAFCFPYTACQDFLTLA